MKKLFVPLVFIPALLFSQSRKERKAMEAQQKADQQVINNLKSHVQYLSSGKTAGQTSTSGISNAVEYVANQFKTAGLQPKGTNGFIQPFSVDDGKIIDPATFLKIHDTLLQVNKEYFPLPFSAEKKVSGMPAMALRERGVPWFIDLKDWRDDSAKTQPTNLEEAIKKEVAKVAAKGATALFLYNSGPDGDGPVFNKKDKSAVVPIPVIYVTPDGYKKYLSDNSQMLDIELNVAFKESKITGSNIIGYIDNAAPATIVIGAHYNMPVANAKTATAQNSAVAGADDNSSGIAMLIELAKLISASKAKRNNYLFLALGGADDGLSASSHWLTNNNVTAPINYMLNLDMVGSYSDSKKLSVQGYSSSPVWNTVFPSVADKKLIVAIDSTGTVTGPPEPFLNTGIPVLSFSSAQHNDYRNNTDEEGRINYAGALQIARFISRLVEVTDSKGKVPFARTPHAATRLDIPVHRFQEQQVASLP